MPTTMTNEQQKRILAGKLGFNLPSATDFIHREDFDTDIAYQFALIQMQQIMSTPEFQKAAQKVSHELAEEEEREMQKQRRKEFEEIRKSVMLSSYDEEEINRKAAQQAQVLLGRGEISYSELGKKTAEIASQLESAAKDEKAENIQMSNFIRAECHRNSVKADSEDE